jgi:RNA polymerase sigma-70 factor (ECF subfamily)
MRVYETALKEVPERPRQFLFAAARNLLIDRVRHARVIPIEAAADVEALDIAADTPAPDRSLLARDELRVLQAALDGLPERCRQAIILGRIDGLSRSEIAARMGVTEAVVSNYMSAGIRKLVEAFYGEARIGRRQP